MPGPTQALSPNGENNNDIIQDNGTIIPFRKHTVRGERSYRGGHPSFVAVVGIFDESFGMRCWQRFCINISDNMFRQISSLKLEYSA
ncbi:hypothetical protein DV515_00000240 [Chloebia gouldiae]|uniref:Uncharacterized protein n=1 Tax=Chloebia gouldiae TaxID=44316 RepID=A0A3L8T150_CHLGU|nr:hypothetical protein DV515_00000240 [Chloebia gouldiae]